MIGLFCAIELLLWKSEGRFAWSHGDRRRGFPLFVGALVDIDKLGSNLLVEIGVILILSVAISLQKLFQIQI